MTDRARRRLRRVALSTIAALAILGAGCGDDAETAPRPDGATTDTAGSAVSVELTTPDGETLHAVLTTADTAGGGRGAVVLAHQRGSDLHSWDAVVSRLADAGLTVLAFDFRGYGDSTGERDTALDVDLRAAIDYVASTGAEPITVIGASMGGTAAAAVAADRAVPIDAVVTLSAPGDFLGLDAIGAASDVDHPWLVVSAEDDQPYAGDAAEMASAAADAELVLLGGRTHGAGLFAEHPELYDRVLELLPVA